MRRKSECRLSQLVGRDSYICVVVCKLYATNLSRRQSSFVYEKSDNVAARDFIFFAYIEEQCTVFCRYYLGSPFGPIILECRKNSGILSWSDIIAKARPLAPMRAVRPFRCVNASASTGK